MSKVIKYDIGTCKFRLCKNGIDTYCIFMHADGKNSLVKAVDFLDRMLGLHTNINMFIPNTGDSLCVDYKVLYNDEIKHIIVSPDDYIVVVYKHGEINPDEFAIDHLVSLDRTGFHGLFVETSSVQPRNPRAIIYPGGQTKIKIDTRTAFDILYYLNNKTRRFYSMIQAFRITPSGIEQLIKRNTLYKKINIGREIMDKGFNCTYDAFAKEKYEQYGSDTIFVAVTVDNITCVAGNDDILMFGDINDPIKTFSSKEFNKFMRSGKAPSNIKVYN